MLSPYAAVVEKLHKSLDKEKVTMLKIERAGDVLADTVSLCNFEFIYRSSHWKLENVSFLVEKVLHEFFVAFRRSSRDEGPRKNLW